MRQFLQAPAVRAGLAIAFSAIIVPVWLINDMPIAILPALLSSIWVPLFITQGSPPPRKGLRVALTAIGVGVLLIGALVLTFVYFNVREADIDARCA